MFISPSFFFQIPTNYDEFEGHEIPKAVRENALIWIHNHVHTNLQKLYTELETQSDFDNGVVSDKEAGGKGGRRREGGGREAHTNTCLLI